MVLATSPEVFTGTPEGDPWLDFIQMNELEQKYGWAIRIVEYSTGHKNYAIYQAAEHTALDPTLAWFLFACDEDDMKALVRLVLRNVFEQFITV